MQSGSKDKRIDVKLLLQEEADIADEPLTPPGPETDQDQAELSALTARHESLRRQVALLRAQLSESGRAKPQAEVVADNARIPVVTVFLTAISAVVLAAWSLRRVAAA